MLSVSQSLYDLDVLLKTWMGIDRVLGMQTHLAAGEVLLKSRCAIIHYEVLSVAVSESSCHL